jgi:hydrocephalus-inducing protein
MVRSSTSKSIKLENHTSSNWQLRPVISNDFWSGAEFLQVPAGGSAEYSLLYKPLTMTQAEGQPHQGSVFFPLPDGSGLLYILHGQVGDHILPQLYGATASGHPAHCACKMPQLAGRIPM